MAIFSRSVASRVQSNVTEVCLQESECYPLAVPSVYWPNSDQSAKDTPDPEMLTMPVVLTTVSHASVYLTGGRHAVHTNDGELVSSDRVPDKILAQIPWQSHQHLEGTSLLLGNSAGAACYYHWMLDILPKLGFLQRAGIDLNSIDHFLVREVVSAFQKESLNRLGIDEARIVQTAKQPYVTCDKVMLVKLEHHVNLTMHRFVPEWVNASFGSTGNERDQADMQGQHRVDHDPVKREKLYIRRPANVRRAIENADEVEALLSSHGFECLAMEGLSIEQQAALLSQADVVVSQHGGALTNMVFAKPGTKVIELFGTHVYPFYFGLANVCRHDYFAVLQGADDYACLVQKDAALQKGSDENVSSTQAMSFCVDIPALEKTLKHALSD